MGDLLGRKLRARSFDKLSMAKRSFRRLIKILVEVVPETTHDLKHEGAVWFEHQQSSSWPDHVGHIVQHCWKIGDAVM